MFSTHINKLILSLGISAISLSLVIYSQFSKLVDISIRNTQNGDKLTYQLDEERQAASIELLKKIPSFGFDNLAADWTFLSFLQYFGDKKARDKTGYNLSPDFFDIIIERDPRFIKPYFFLSTSTSLYAGHPKRSVALMEKGLQSLSPKNDPSSYLVWLYKATDELLFLGNNQSARRSYLKVGEWAKYYDDPDGKRLSILTRRTASYLANKPNSKSAQINAWLLVFVNAVDDDARQRAIQNIKKLGGTISFTEHGTVRVEHPKGD